MELIKSIFSALVDLTIGPVLRLRHIVKMTATDIVVTAISIAARVAIIGSFFFAVPSFLVTLAWVWILVMPLVAVVVGIIALLISGVALSAMANLMEEAAQEENEAVPADSIQPAAFS